MKVRTSNSSDNYCVTFLCVRTLHVSYADVGSIATFPSSMCLIIPSVSITNVARLPKP